MACPRTAQLTGVIGSDRALVSWIGRGELREIEALIAWNGELTDVAAAAIAGARDAEMLEFVDLSWNAIGADGAAALASSTSLRRLKRHAHQRRTETPDMTDTSKPVGGQPIYRGMDRAALDAAYNNRAAVADSDRWLEQWRRRSDAVRAMPGARLDVAYGPKERTRLDYFSAGTSGAPLFVFLHGGYWQRNSKDMFSFVAEGPRMHGIDVAVVGYTLAPDARLSEIVGEIAQALSFLESNASTFGFDRGAMCVGGWSAGGHLAAMSCGQVGVRGALAISGIFDLEPIALTYLNDRLQLDADEIATLSPARLLRPGMAPLALAVGGDELTELRRQSTSFKDIADTLGVPMTLQVLPGHHHFSILDELARADGALTHELLRLVARDPQGGRAPP